MSFLESFVSRLRSYPTLYPAIRAVGGPVYRAALHTRLWYLKKRHGWTIPATMPPGFGIGFILGRWEVETTSVITNELFEGATFVDVGANIGYYTRLAARVTGPTGRVFAFEPEPENFRALTRNTAAAHNVVLVSAAVGEATTVRPLFLGDVSGTHSIVYKSSQGDASVWVSTVSLDEFAGVAGLERIDLVKVDAEGASPHVVAGMRRLLREGRVATMVIEFGPVMIEAGGQSSMGFLAELMTQFDVSIIEHDRYRLSFETMASIEDARRLTDTLKGGVKGKSGVVNLLCRRKTESR